MPELPYDANPLVVITAVLVVLSLIHLGQLLKD